MKVEITGYPEEREQQIPQEMVSGRQKIELTSYPEKESWPAYIGRNVAGHAATFAKSAIDLPSNIARVAGTINNAGVAASNKLGSYIGLPAEEGGNVPVEKIPNISDYTIKPLEKALGVGKYLAPKTKVEEKLHDITSDIASLMTPLPGLGAAYKAGKAALVAGSGGFSKWLSQKIGASEGTSEVIKMGTMLGTSLLGKSGLKDYRSKLYDNAEAALPKAGEEILHGSPLIDATKIEKLLPSLEKNFSRGEMTPSKQFLKARIDAIKSKIKEGKIDVREAWELKRNINEHIADLTKPYGVEKKLPVLAHGLSEVLHDYGKINKNFGREFFKAEDVTKGMIKATPTNAFLQKHVNKDKIGKITGGMLLGYITPPAAIGLTGASLGTRETAKIFERFKNSSTIRKYYANVISNAARRNVGGMNKAAKQLDDYISEDFPENRP